VIGVADERDDSAAAAAPVAELIDVIIARNADVIADITPGEVVEVVEGVEGNAAYRAEVIQGPVEQPAGACAMVSGEG